MFPLGKFWIHLLSYWYFFFVSKPNWQNNIHIHNYKIIKYYSSSSSFVNSAWWEHGGTIHRRIWWATLGLCFVFTANCMGKSVGHRWVRSSTVLNRNKSAPAIDVVKLMQIRSLALEGIGAYWDNPWEKIRSWLTCSLRFHTFVPNASIYMSLATVPVLSDLPKTLALC